MRINNNMMAMNTHRQLGAANAGGAKSMEKLSSGMRINRAGDDAAGLSISEKMRGQIRGLNQASANAQDGISMIQTAEGALNETHAILQRMRELSNQSANGTNTEEDRSAIQDELNQLTSEINRIGNTTEFNTQKVLNGGMAGQDGSKITEATSAKFTTGPITAAAISADTKITVDNITFDLEGVGGTLTADADGATAAAKALGEVTSGGTKLSDLVEITTTDTHQLVFTAKSTGSNSSIEFNQIDAAIASTATKETGDPATIERHGIEASVALGATGGTDTTIAAGATFEITVGDESAVTVNLNTGVDAKVYKTDSGVDENAKRAAMQDVIQDINSALQEAGLDGKVTASLSKDNKVQFVSETGLDITLKDGTHTPLIDGSGLGLGIDIDADTVKNVDQVIGSGAQGSGFNTSFQIGANKGQSMSLQINDMRSAALGITGNSGEKGFTKEASVTNGTTDIKQEAALNVMNKEDATKSIETLDKAIASVSSERGKLGAIQNRLEHTIKNLDTSAENLQSAEARIRDVDMAKEMMEQTKQNILSQASTAMLANANSQPQSVLQLLG